ncbi:MAG TPA: hypothetical protein VEM95_06955 [Thermoplasmata archaeon]|nr:hypothetical protein [Thermoplasmata archaeon]
MKRVLLRAGRTAYTYPELLEVRAGSVLILRPSDRAKKRHRIVSTILTLAYLLMAGWITVTFVALPVTLGGLAGFGVALFVAAIIMVGMVGILFWWDRWSLPFLATNPTATIPVELLSIRSHELFQEIRGRAAGEEVGVTIPGSQERLLGRAMRFAGIPISSSLAC